MGFFKSVATKAVVTVARGLGLTSPDLIMALGGQSSAAGKVVTVDTALQLDTVYACVRLLSQTIATLPLLTYRQDDAGHNTVAQKHPLYRILHDQPNADMTATEFWEAIVSNVLLWGNAYAEISRGVTGQVVALTPMRSDRVSIRWQPDGSPLYVYSWMGQVTELQEGDVLHIKGFSLDGRMGMSSIAYGRQTFGTAIAMEEAAAKVFANGMRPSGYMSSPTILTAQQREKTKELLQRFQGSENTGKVPLLEGGWKFEALSIPPEDGQLLQSRSFSVEQICRWFDVPPIMIGHMEKSTAWGTGMEQMMLWFLTFSLRPHLERIEQAVKRDLIDPTEPDVVAEFKIDGLLRADSAARAALYSSLTQNGVISSNDARRLENMPASEEPGSDDLRVQSNMIRLQDLGKIATMPKDKPVQPGEAVSANPDPGGVAPKPGLFQR